MLLVTRKKVTIEEVLNSESYFEEVCKAYNNLKPNHFPSAEVDTQLAYIGASVYTNEDDWFFSIYLNDDYVIELEVTHDGDPETKVVAEDLEKLYAEDAAQVLLEAVSEKL